MDASVDDNLRKEALHLYFIEVKDTQQEAELEEEEVEHVLLNGKFFLCLFLYATVVEIRKKPTDVIDLSFELRQTTKTYVEKRQHLFFLLDVCRNLDSNLMT